MQQIKLTRWLLEAKADLDFFLFFNVPGVTNTAQQCTGTAKGVDVVSCYKADQHKFMWVASWELIQGGP